MDLSMNQPLAPIEDKRGPKRMFMLTAIFWALIIIFLMIVSSMVVSAFERYISPPFMFISWGSFFLLGGALIFLTLKEKVEGKLKKFLILTGASAVGFLVSIVLHNGFYALAVISSHIVVLHSVMEALDVGFFLISVFLCPLGFLIGAVGSIILFIRKK